MCKIAFRHTGRAAYRYWNVTLIYHLKTSWHVTCYKKWNILRYPIYLWINEMCRSKKGKNNFKLSKELHEDNREFWGFFPYWLFPELKVSQLDWQLSYLPIPSDWQQIMERLLPWYNSRE